MNNVVQYHLLLKTYYAAAYYFDLCIDGYVKSIFCLNSLEINVESGVCWE